MSITPSLDIAAAGITPRELEILELVAEHLSNQEIGQRLFIGVRTVETHVASLLRKLQVVDRRALARLAPEVLAERPVSTGFSPSIPADLTPLVGRHLDLDAVEALLGSRRLVTLTGPGGTGKTRLAFAVARRKADAYSGGIVTVELAGLADAELVPEAVAAALGLRDAAKQGSSMTARVVEHFGDREVLVVLDNCEQVSAVVAPFTRALLESCPNLRVLATSRESLGISGEAEWHVPPLNVPPAGAATAEEVADVDAVRLFVERARDVGPGFELSDADAPAVAEICRRLDGIPLAIELAAARLRVLSARQLADRLADQLSILTESGRDRPDRQRTMRATLDWSHTLLDVDERIAFRRLSVFAGGFALDGAEHVLVGDGIEEAQVLDVVERLSGKSLLTTVSDGREPRLRMLEPVRQYAAELLEGAVETQRVADAHVAWIVALAENAALGFFGEQGVWSTRLDAEHDNIAAALARSFSTGDVDSAMRIGASLAFPWFTMGPPDAGYWLDRVLAASEGASPGKRSSVLLAAGMSAVNTLDLDRAVELLSEALDSWRERGRRRGEAWALLWLGRASGGRHVDDRQPSEWFQQALTAFREVDEPVGIGWSLAFLAQEAIYGGDVEGAELLAAEARMVGRRNGVTQVVAEAERVLARTAAARGDYEHAEQLLAAAMQANRAANDRFQAASVAATAAEIALDRGDLVRTVELLRNAMSMSRNIGSGERLRHTLDVAVPVLWATERQEAAAVVVGVLESNSRRPASEARSRAVEVATVIAGTALETQRTMGREMALVEAADLALRELPD